MSTWTCVACNENCEHIDLTEFDLSMLQGRYCPYADTCCEWKKEHEADDEFICSICGETAVGFGHNPAPYSGERCCDRCNGAVIRARFQATMLRRQLTDDELRAVLNEERIHGVVE